MLSSVRYRLRGMVRNSVRWIARRLPSSIVTQAANSLLSSYNFADELQRMQQADRVTTQIPEMSSFRGERLQQYVLASIEPWTRFPLTPTTIPGMLTRAEEKYYTWIAGFYEGVGDVVEIGAWLGRSTSVLVQGLLKNPKFSGHKLHVFDGFTWFETMNKWMPSDMRSRTPQVGESFEHLFREQTAEFAEHLDCRRMRLAANFGGCLCDDTIPELTWSGGPIELLFIDCGGTLDVNETWFRALEKSFIPNRTLIVMQDWQNFKSVPYPCWVHTKQFTDLHADRLRLLHEIKEGGIACFLYTSPAGHRQPTG